ncbi:MAG: SPOR domain-containing protein [Marinovum sp.]|nr:SPOR domain-containing protein [Marinovum sp.]
MYGLLVLTGCEEGVQMPAFLQPKPTADGAPASSPISFGRKVERDVEAPEVFQVTEAGLWDGRPSLGGVWVAHPDVTDPERVIIRNPSNGKFVIGALFRRERETPGPRLQVSSDAASALGLVAGAPTNLNVTALRRETAQEAPAPDQSLETTEVEQSLDAPEDVTAAPLDDVATTAAAALDAASVSGATTSAAASPEAAPTVTSNLTKPFIQIGIFSIQKNAQNTAATMRRAGLIPTIKKGSSSGKAFWRVIVGPATSAEERSELLRVIKAQGFTDAYAVTN